MLVTVRSCEIAVDFHELKAWVRGLMLMPRDNCWRISSFLCWHIILHMAAILRQQTPGKYLFGNANVEIHASAIDRLSDPHRQITEDITWYFK